LRGAAAPGPLTPTPGMTAAGPLLLAVISSVLWLTRGFDPAPSACSALASGVLYGSFSLKDLFPTISSGCSWTLENPDPTKYSLYLRFNREEQEDEEKEEEEEEEEEDEAELELCEGAGPFTFLHFDKNFVQLCLAAEPEAAPRLLAPQALEFRFVEVLLINNNNSSQFTCSVLCRWLEECLQAPGTRRCGLTHAGCSCQAESPPGTAPQRLRARRPHPNPAAPRCHRPHRALLPPPSCILRMPTGSTCPRCRTVSGVPGRGAQGLGGSPAPCRLLRCAGGGRGGAVCVEEPSQDHKITDL
uniref:Adhesion G protein-coupled receptor B N-terminal domain-containing protein n=1 Tax=Anas platyrhynchos platyrhynchos TaxID=8840 RepID=A0A493TFN6_ANAPP